MTDKIYTIDEIKDIITPIAKRHCVSRVYLFGSYARGEADCSSDIDLRIDAERLRTLFALGGLYADLEQAFNKPLDLITTQSLRQNKSDPMTRRLIQSMRREEKLLYEE